MEIKICGLTRPEDAALAAELGADYSGVVLYPGSPSGVGVEQAAAIFAAAGSALRVGVFVRPGIELLDEAVEKAGLDVIQLHGGESYEYINEVKERFPGCLVWAARHIADADEIESALSCPADRLVLDAANGGSGMVCDWSLAARVAAARPVMLAGGLNAGNIAEAVKSVNPFGVDLSSGVESGEKGIKSHIKLKEIFNILREIR